MLVIVSYDVSTVDPAGKKRLRTVAKICKDYGIRVQNSVFECNVDPVQWLNLKNSLLSVYSPDLDSLRFYYLGSNYKNKVEHCGAKMAVDVEETLIL
ncbi:MAG: CRISPR-associated endonuclease Cas2 [Lentisphaeria bacterium]|nr:CRISPR-associated endonuclease Cas2 [Lentisphaeria bacterium]